MTAYALEEAIRKADAALNADNRQIQNVIYSLLRTLVQHEAHKAAEATYSGRMQTFADTQ